MNPQTKVITLPDGYPVMILTPEGVDVIYSYDLDENISEGNKELQEEQFHSYEWEDLHGDTVRKFNYILFDNLENVIKLTDEIKSHLLEQIFQYRPSLKKAYQQYQAELEELKKRILLYEQGGYGMTSSWENRLYLEPAGNNEFDLTTYKTFYPDEDEEAVPYEDEEVNKVFELMELTNPYWEMLTSRFRIKTGDEIFKAFSTVLYFSGADSVHKSDYMEPDFVERNWEGCLDWQYSTNAWKQILENLRSHPETALLAQQLQEKLNEVEAREDDDDYSDDYESDAEDDDYEEDDSED